MSCPATFKAHRDRRRVTAGCCFSSSLIQGQTRCLSRLQIGQPTSMTSGLNDDQYLGFLSPLSDALHMGVAWSTMCSAPICRLATSFLGLPAPAPMLAMPSTHKKSTEWFVEA